MSDHLLTAQQRLEALQDMGFSVDLSEAKSEDEKHALLDEVDAMLSGIMGEGLAARDDALEEIAPSEAVAQAFMADVAPQNGAVAQHLKTLHSQSIEESGKDLALTNILMDAYGALGEENYVMTLGHWDPVEIGRLLNARFKADGLAEIAQDILIGLEDSMLEADDPQSHVWNALVKEADSRGIAFLEMVPIGGAWSDQAIIMIDKSKRSKWSAKRIGGLGLLDFPMF